ncbi:DUF3800 domain-containing protein [bacterium]|nr:MAG: DUF3800 domain-containing protein [bacterium]
MHGYFDESGTHNTSRVTTIAGFVATTDQWRKCLVEWEAALSAKHLKQFHASEFGYFAKANKWSSDEYSEFVGNLTRILNNHTWFGVSGSVITSAYENLPDEVRKRIGGRYQYCFRQQIFLSMK